MKLKNIITTSTLAVLLIAAAGCSKEKFDINSNPDAVTDISVTPSVLLPGALQSTSTNIVSEWWFISWWMGHGARSGSYQSLNEEETYVSARDRRRGAALRRFFRPRSLAGDGDVPLDGPADRRSEDNTERHHHE